MVRAPQPSRGVARPAIVARSSAPGLALAFALGLASSLVSSTAIAGDGRVVVIDVDPRVADALVVALSPWSLTVVRAPGPSPSSDIDAAAARARVVASDLHAGAVVWMSPPRPPDDQASLWVYDAQTLELAVRPVTVWAPFDDAGAAAVALSVKTVLRASPLITPEPSPPEPALAPPEHPIAAANPSEPAPRSAPAVWRFETVVGAHVPTGTGAGVEARAALGASAWPKRFGDHAGVGLDLQAGPGVAVGTSSFQGELREVGLDTTVRARSALSPWFALEISGGPALLLTSLDGQSIPDGTSLHALRLDPALDLGAVGDFAVAPRVSLGVTAMASALLRYQRYSLDGAPLLDGPPVVVLLGLRLALEVD